MEKQTIQGNEFVFTHFVMLLIKRKWLIIAGTLILTLIAMVYSFFMPRIYRGEGFFQFPGEDYEQRQMKSVIKKKILIPDYKKFSVLFTNPQRLIDFIVNNGFFSGVELEEIKKNVKTSVMLEKQINPIFRFSKDEVSDLVTISEITKNYTMGVHLSGENQSPEAAQKFVKIIGLFIKNCIIDMKLNDYIIAEFNNSQTGMNGYENEIIKSEFKLDQLYEKLQKKKALLKKYPQSKTFGNRELVSVEKGGDRFLSPIAQLVGIESQIIDIKEQLAHLHRNKELMKLKYSFFLKLKEILKREIFGEALLNRMVELTEKLFNLKENTVDTKKEVFNDLKIDLDNFISIKDEMKFVSGPTLPKTPVKPNKKLIIIMVFLIALFIFIFIAILAEWWMLNRDSLKHWKK